MSHILVGLEFLFGIVDGIDDGSMSFSAEVFTYPLERPLKKFLGHEHQDLTRIGDLFLPGIGFQFLDGDAIILSDHIDEQIEILGSLGI